MAASFWETHLWQWFTPGQLVLIALSLGIGFGTLAVRYARVKRWDRAWKERWEQGHSKSLDVLRRTKQRNLKGLTITRRMMFALFFMGLGASFEPVVWMIKGSRRLPLLVIEALVSLNVALLVALVALIAAVQVGKYELKRIDELLAPAAESTPRRS